MKHQHLASYLSLMALIVASACSSAHAVTFTPPATGGAPSQSTGGASRGNFFVPATGRSAPSQSTGGASRGNFFAPAPGRTAPSQSTGGASRGHLFTPTPGRSAPSQAAGGASRGDLFKPATGNGSPTKTAGGASRVGTYYLNPSMVGAGGPAALIALLPQSFYGTTLSDRPTILVYLPASNAEKAVFSLKDEAGNMLYQTTISVAGKMGIIPVRLPADAPALAIGKNYQWFVALKLDGELNPSTPYVDGWIQRIQPNVEVAAAMQQGDLLQRATVLGKNGVWYDCVATLAALHAAQPDNAALTQQWAELLSSVGLQDIKTMPVLMSAN